MISPSSIQKLKDRVDILDIIGAYVPLRRAGSGYRGVCPFHDDHDPSMSVSPERGMYHCFACKAGGDVFKFVMDIEHISYPEAVEKIAQMSGFVLDYTSSNKQEQSKLASRHILPSLNAMYQARLNTQENAKAYIAQRGISPLMASRFELGWAGEAGLTFNLLASENIEPSSALAVGALKQGEKGLYPSFTNRITFPIYSPKGALVGFGGRTLANDKNVAKYINSPQSELFDKSRLLYGYHLARKEIYAKGRVIITEGYLDVIMLHQAGFTNAVAVLGTALTPKHLPLLKRENIEVVLCFDADNAGYTAATKSAHLLSTNEIDGSVVMLRQGADPADMVAGGEIARLDELLNSGTEIGQFYIKHIISGFDLSRPLQRQKCQEAITAYLAQMGRVAARAYADIAGRILGLSAEAILPKEHFVKAMPKQLTTKPKPAQSLAPKDLLEASVLKGALDDANIRQYLIQIQAKKFFLNYADKFEAVIAGDLSDEFVRELAISPSFKGLEGEQSLQDALTHLQVRYYEQLRKNVINSSQISEDTMIYLEKINKIIAKLNQKRQRIK